MTKSHIPQDHADPFLTTHQAALLLGVSLRSIQLWVEAGTLSAGRTPGGHRRIRRSAVEALAGQNDISLAPTPAQAAAARDVKELRAQLDRALADGKRLHEAYLGAERELEAARAEIERLKVALQASEASDAESVRMYREARDARDQLRAGSAEMAAVLTDIVAMWNHHCYAHGDGMPSPLHVRAAAAIGVRADGAAS